ncbi:MAG: hypothetical protein WBQ48_05670 [Aeromicrobium sp.]
MPRRHTRRRPPVSGRPVNERIETRGSTEWHVRALAGSDKSYRCPGCHQAIHPGAGHLLIWPVHKSLLSAEAIDERRHWHTSCWQRRL